MLILDGLHRLTPPLIGLMLLAMFMTPYISNGPYYPELEFAIARPCRKSWWAVLLHVQNYGVNLPDMVMSASTSFNDTLITCKYDF